MLLRLLTLKKLLKLLMLRGSLAFNANNAPKTFKIGYQSLKYCYTILYDSTNISRHVIMLMMRFDMILKHVQTCHNAFDAIWCDSQTCPDLSQCFWCNLIRFSNMSRLVMMLMMQFDVILKYVQTCHNAYDAIWYDSQTCLDLSETARMTKYTKIE